LIYNQNPDSGYGR